MDRKALKEARRKQKAAVWASIREGQKAAEEDLRFPDDTEAYIEKVLSGECGLDEHKGSTKNSAPSGGYHMTLDEIGKIEGLSRTRVAQIEKKALRKLKRYCELHDRSVLLFLKEEV